MSGPSVPGASLDASVGDARASTAAGSPTSPTPARRGSLVGGFVVKFLALVGGIHAVAVVPLAFIVLLNVVVLGVTRSLSAPLLFAGALVSGVVCAATFFLAKVADTDLPGLVVDELAQPELTTMVRMVAGALGAPPPRVIRLTHEVGISVLPKGRARQSPFSVSIGVALLHGISVDEFRALLAHEMGHYSATDSRSDALVYRTYEMMRRSVAPSSTLGGSAFASYCHFFLRHSLVIRAKQEQTADAVAARVAGWQALLAALHRSSATTRAYALLTHNFVRPCLDAHRPIRNLFPGLDALLADSRRISQFDAKISERTNWLGVEDTDAHLPLAERIPAITALASVAPGRVGERDRRPAITLLALRERVEEEVTRSAEAEVAGIGLGGVDQGQTTRARLGQPIEWEDVAAEVLAPRYRHDAFETFEALDRLVPGGRSSMRTLLQLLAEGKGESLAVHLVPTIKTLPPDQQAAYTKVVVRHHVAAVIATFLVDHLEHRWALSWSTPVQVVDRRGEFIEPYDEAEELLTDREKVAELQRDLEGDVIAGSWRPRPPAE